MAKSTMVDETQPLMSSKGKDLQPVAPAPWACAVPSTRTGSRYLPQAIGHRGYKAVWPENSMGAFKGAVEVGAHALETDVHLSADGIVVLSHDPSLKRCFGVDKKISDCGWNYLSTLRTLKEPKQGLPRLSDLLEWVNQPELEKIWIMLDIKMDDTAEDLMGAIADTIAAVSPVSAPWEQRILLGCWNASFLEAAHRKLPTFSLALITFSVAYAYNFLPVPNLGMNMVQKMLMGPIGGRFLRDCRRAGRPMFTWTVNDEDSMEWCIKKNTPDGRGEKPMLDGVITDDPKMFLEVCRRWEDELDGIVAPRKKGLVKTVKKGTLLWVKVGLLHVFATIFYILWRHVWSRLDLLSDEGGLKSW